MFTYRGWDGTYAVRGIVPCWLNTTSLPKSDASRLLDWDVDVSGLCPVPPSAVPAGDAMAGARGTDDDDEASAYWHSIAFCRQFLHEG
jgi:hypothetical protein